MTLSCSSMAAEPRNLAVWASTKSMLDIKSKELICDRPITNESIVFDQMIERIPFLFDILATINARINFTSLRADQNLRLSVMRFRAVTIITLRTRARPRYRSAGGNSILRGME